MLERYLEELRAELNRRDVEDVDEVVSYFEEIINDRVDNGETEEEIIASLGPAQELLDGIYERKERTEKTADLKPESLSLSGISDIDINVETYDVRIMSCESESGRMEYDRSEDVSLDVRVRGTKLSVDQNLPATVVNAFFAKIFRTGNGSFAGKLNIWLPKNRPIDLEISDVSGDVGIEGLVLDDAEIDMVNGDLSLEDLQVSGLEVNIVTGDVKMRSVSVDEDLEIDSVSGDVDADHIRCSDIAISTVSGDVELLIDGVREDYTIEDNRIASRKTYTGSGTSKLDLNTVSGDLSYLFTE